jgi:hypothetical protein
VWTSYVFWTSRASSFMEEGVGNEDFEVREGREEVKRRKPLT